ncbi:cysteine proteinase [Diplocarpon rosae]|nr:cysteine proteinase [Diplocarpon rosae]
MPVNQEIDHLGVTLLIDVLLKPIGFAVEIVYLDRSPGAQVNSHIFQPEDAHGIPTNPGGPVIHLLYRPSHYDILYQDQASARQAIADAACSTDLQVHRATSFSQHLAIQSTPASMGGFSPLDILSCIPGFSLAPHTSHHGFSSQYSQQMEPYPPSPLSASLSPTSSDASAVVATSSHLPPPQPQPPSAQTSFSTPTSHLPIRTHNPPLSPTASKTSFRPSVYEFQAVADWQEGPVVFQTSTDDLALKNSKQEDEPGL